ncbi:Ig-like domain-containing protein [Rheinheimera sp.]|uniref:Ig-like domain-containing protein n=1 Tax=Rheinheimera sp. TaxID=1869214 RepID=UPI00273540B5|nr:Ig-like domain-containing protein [Rheinheimera sp.]MDP2715302.1 Ig-like domain-containing protein [Rheinheimera sp.]
MNKLTLVLALAAAAVLTGCNDSDKPNVAPQLGGNSFVTETDVAVVDRLNASDDNGDSLLFAVTALPQNGSLTLAEDGNFTYTPAAEFTGSDSFMVAVSDGELTTNGEVTIDVAVAVVSFLTYSRTAFNQDEQAPALPLNGRDFTQDAMNEADYADLLSGQ